MKLAEKLIKLAAAIAAIAGIAYLVVKYFDAIKAWAEKLCPCCAVEEDFETEETAEEETPVEEPAAEEAVEEVVEEVAADDAPVAEEADFEA